MKAYQFIKVDRDGDLGIVTLNRPDRSNAWNAQMRADVTEALHALNADESVRAVILTGAGDRAFGGGQDFEEAQQFDATRAVSWMKEWERLYGAILDMEKPIIAALNGVAAGSAFQAALLCDIRIGHAGSRMGQTEINNGIPSVTGTWAMWDILGRARTIEMVMTGKLVDGNEAYRLGMLNHLVPQDQVMAKAKEVARELGAKPPIAMKLNKQLWRKLSQPGFAAAEADGIEIQSAAFASGEPQAMMARFLAEHAARKPKPAAR